MHRLLARTLLLTLLVSWQGYAQTAIEVFELQNRSAEELRPAIETVVGEEGSVSARDMKLVVRAPEETMSRIADVIADLDTRPAQLRITVRQVEDNDIERQGGTVSGHAGTEGDGSVGTRIYRSKGADEENVLQTLRTLEGRWAGIEIGELIPFGGRRSVRDGGAVYSEESIEHKEVTRGFRVRPRLAGDRVILDIVPHARRPDSSGGGRIDVRSAETTVSAPLDEWIDIGGSITGAEERGSGVTYSTRSARARNVRIQLKVERLE